MAKTLYCSLDLELTGFDPTRDSILEVGFVIFEPTATGLEITEQWTQTFRPTSLVHPKILGLTGLTQAELDASPSFNDFREFLQEKLRDVILVGHNITVDATFLEAFGIKLSGRTIDTLDLVQFMLPTHHSYNLENLMHYFQIPHPDAHRALADSIAVVKVLEQFIASFNTFPQELKEKFNKLVAPAGFEWAPLFNGDTKPTITKTEEEKHFSNFVEASESDFPDHTVSLASYGTAPLKVPVGHDNSKTLLAVADKNKVLELWRQGKAHGIFSPPDLFNEEKFQRFLARENLTQDEIRFALKILVWKYTNWQHETILDLNHTFFGGQFRNYISPGPLQPEYNHSVLATDFPSLPYLSQNAQLSDRQLILSSVHEFERDLSTGKERRISWQRFLHIIRSMEWNETNELSIPMEIINQAITATDLFFGLVNLTVQRNFAQYNYVGLNDLALNARADRHIREAADNYVNKITNLFFGYDVPELRRPLEKLKSFFEIDPDHIKWIETTPTNCAFYNQPLHVLGESQKIMDKFVGVSASEDFSEPVLSYLLARLGLDGFKRENKGKTTALSIQFQTLDLNKNNLVDILSAENLPAAVVMGSTQEIKDFYNKTYDTLKQYATIYAQGYSGGSNKILRNFGIKPESILLGTGQLLLNQESKRLRPKTMVITGFPKENLNHPYVKALREYWEPRFPNIGAVLNAYLLMRMLKTCLHEGLKTIYVAAPHNDTDRYLYETLQKLPFVTINPQS